MLIVNTRTASTMVMGVNHVNLSTNLKNPAANTNARVLCPVSFIKAQGPRRLPNILCNCTGEQCVHPVHLFTKLGTFSLTKSGGFPTPYRGKILRVPGKF